MSSYNTVPASDILGEKQEKIVPTVDVGHWPDEPFKDRVSDILDQDVASLHEVIQRLTQENNELKMNLENARLYSSSLHDEWFGDKMRAEQILEELNPVSQAALRATNPKVYAFMKYFGKIEWEEVY